MSENNVACAESLMGMNHSHEGGGDDSRSNEGTKPRVLGDKKQLTERVDQTMLEHAMRGLTTNAKQAKYSGILS